MAAIYEISPLTENKTILKQLIEIQKHLKNNPLYKVYYANVDFVSGTLIYDLDDVKLGSDTLNKNDVIIFKNNYYAVVASVGDTTYTIEEGISFKGDKGDTGATGATGATGNGIASIAKTSTSGLVDTYTITFTNGNTTTFEITNGKDGTDGTNGTDGVGIASIAKTSTSGLVDTYTITLTNGNTTTFEITNGKDGTDGTNGTNGTDGVGIASIAKTSTSGLVDTYTITLTNGNTTTFEVTNGKDGTNGTNGTNGTDGTDGVGISTITSSQSGNVVTITITLTNSTTQTFTFTAGSGGGGSIQSITFTSKADFINWYSQNKSKITGIKIGANSDYDLPCKLRLFNNFSNETNEEMSAFEGSVIGNLIGEYNGASVFQCCTNLFSERSNNDMTFNYKLVMLYSEGSLIVGAIIDTQYCNYGNDTNIGLLYSTYGSSGSLTMFELNKQSVQCPDGIFTDITLYYIG